MAKKSGLAHKKSVKAYKDSGRQLINKRRKVRKHIKCNPNDLQALGDLKRIG